MQTRGKKRKFSRLRQSLVDLADEVKRLIEPFLSDQALIKGSVYELKSKCGKPGCKCTKGQLHRRMVVSASDKGKTRLRVIARGFVSEIQNKVRRYQRLRRARARLVVLHKEMLEVIDEMEAMRREEMK